MPWSARIHTGFHVYGATQDTTRFAFGFDYRAVTFFGPPFQTVLLPSAFHIVVLQPQQDKSRWFGLFRFRSPLLTESILFIFLRLLRCFTSPRIASPDYEFIRSITGGKTGWVVPFGDPRIKACLRLPVAYRNLLRPSSPLGTKAFTISP